MTGVPPKLTKCSGRTHRQVGSFIIITCSKNTVSGRMCRTEIRPLTTASRRTSVGTTRRTRDRSRTRRKARIEIDKISLNRPFRSRVPQKRRRVPRLKLSNKNPHLVGFSARRLPQATSPGAFLTSLRDLPAKQ